MILRRLDRRQSAADLIASGVKPGSANTILSRLESRGLVSSQDEGRDRTWGLTEQGLRLVDALRAAERVYSE